MLFQKWWHRLFEEAIDECPEGHDIRAGRIRDSQPNALGSAPRICFRRVPLNIAYEYSALHTLPARSILVITPDPNFGTAFSFFPFQPTELMPCTLEHDDFSFVSSSGTSDSVNVPLSASKRPVQKSRKTTAQIGNAQALRLVPPCV
jgi:hypothetical protein